MAKKTKIEDKWEQLFERYDIIGRVEENGIFEIAADEVREYKEPRLMAKFDHESKLPAIFRKNKLSILPISRSKYVISNFSAYHFLEENESTLKHFSLPSHIESINRNSINTETIALNAALDSGILEDFLEDEDILPTVSGRMCTGAFNFKIDNSRSHSENIVKVENAQMEIDGAYEGRNALSLIEAKLDISDDFHIRQLYYPLRFWSTKNKKPVNTVFMIYSNGIYKFYDYEFTNIENYNSLRLKKYQEYTFDEVKISESDVRHIQTHVKIVEEPNITFPQADRFEKVINLCEILSTQDLTANDIKDRYEFVNRQANYYADAGRYLGLIEKCSDNPNSNSAPLYTLTAKGKSILEKDYAHRQLAFCEAILSHEIFHTVFSEYLSSGSLPSNTRIIEIMRKAGVHGAASNSTMNRRRQTITSWIRWIVSLYSDRKK